MFPSYRNQSLASIWGESLPLIVWAEYVKVANKVSAHLVILWAGKLCIFVQFMLYPARNCTLKVNRNTRTRCEVIFPALRKWLMRISQLHIVYNIYLSIWNLFFYSFKWKITQQGSNWRNYFESWKNSPKDY